MAILEGTVSSLSESFVYLLTPWAHQKNGSLHLLKFDRWSWWYLTTASKNGGQSKTLISYSGNENQHVSKHEQYKTVNFLLRKRTACMHVDLYQNSFFVFNILCKWSIKKLIKDNFTKISISRFKHIYIWQQRQIQTSAKILQRIIHSLAMMSHRHYICDYMQAVNYKCTLSRLSILWTYKSFSVYRSVL